MQGGVPGRERAIGLLFHFTPFQSYNLGRPRCLSSLLDTSSEASFFKYEFD